MLSSIPWIGPDIYHGVSHLLGHLSIQKPVYLFKFFALPHLLHIKYFILQKPQH